MNATEKLNQPEKGNKNNNLKDAGKVAAGVVGAAGAAAAGFAFGRADKHHPHKEDEADQQITDRPEEIAEAQTEELQEITPRPAEDEAQTVQNTETAASHPVNNAGTSHPVNTTAENHPVNNNAVNHPVNNTVENHPVNNTVENGPANNTVNNGPANTNTNNGPESNTTNTAETQNPSNTDEVIVDPDNIAEAIIAGEEIDPNDIEEDSLIAIEEIRPVFTEDGNEVMAARYRDPSGQELVMVDIDGDEHFDISINEASQTASLIDPRVVVTVGDAQLATTNTDEYIPPREEDTTTEFGADSLNDDLIS